MNRLQKWQINVIQELVELGFVGWIIAEVAGCSEGSVHKYKPYSLTAYRRGMTKLSKDTIRSVRIRRKKRVKRRVA